MKKKETPTPQDHSDNEQQILQKKTKNKNKQTKYCSPKRNAYI